MSLFFYIFAYMIETKIYIKPPTEDERRILLENGYQFCDCCTFDKVRLLRLGADKKFHGVGFSCENECRNKDCLLCSLFDDLDHYNVVLLNNIDELFKIEEAIKNNEQGRTN